MTIVLVSCVCSIAQVPTSSREAGPAAGAGSKIKPLKIGDTIPQALWNLPLQMVRAGQEGTSTVTLNDYRDKKLIILDFWATWCAPCISSLYKLDSLQQLFKDQLSAIPLTYEEKGKIRPFMEKKGWKLSSVINNETVAGYFPHRSIPHQVWVKDGIVKAIAGPKDLTKANIEKTLSGKDVPIPLKWENTQYNPAEPLFINGNGGKGEEMLYMSMFSGFIDGLNNAAIDFFNDYISITNAGVTRFFQYAFQQEIPLFAGAYNRIILDMDDSVRSCLVIPDDRQEQLNWLKENTYCYNLFLPKEVQRTVMLSKMKDDINRFFGMRYGIRGSLQVRDVECLVIKNSTPSLEGEGDETRGKTKPGPAKEGATYREFCRRLSFANRKLPTPVVSRAKSVPAHINITSDLSDIPSINRELGGYGLTIVKEPARLEMLVISQLP